MPPIDQLQERLLPGHCDPVFLHGDLTDENVLGYDGDEWIPTHCIDFGDALIGDSLYDCIPLYFSMLKGQRDCFPVAMDPYRAMCLTILHPSAALVALFRYFERAKHAESWADVAALVFGP